MARESQGLQVLLIVFVMLAVVFGVTTYLYVKRADEATKAVTAANAAKQQVESEKRTVEEKIRSPENDDRLCPNEAPRKSRSSLPKTCRPTATRRRRMPTGQGGRRQTALRPQHPLLHNLLAGMYKVIQDRSDEIIKSRAHSPSWERNSRPARRQRTKPSTSTPRAMESWRRTSRRSPRRTATDNRPARRPSINS